MHSLFKGKLRAIDQMLIRLPQSVLDRLPVPWAFQRLPEDIQKRVRKVYYSKHYTFDEKMNFLVRKNTIFKFELHTNSQKSFQFNTFEFGGTNHG